MTVKLIAYTQGVLSMSPEDLLERAFSQCYQKPANIDVVIRNLKHQSVLEHISFSWEVEASRVCWEQLVRHRHASYTAQSHRYTEPTVDDVCFYVPDEIKALGDEAIQEWETDTFLAHQVYKKWRSKGVSKQTARYQINKGVSIKATVTMNLRSLLNFLELRTSPHAQEEIRRLALNMWKTVKPLFPELAPKLEEIWRGQFVD